jgi:hypothetical protein
MIKYFTIYGERCSGTNFLMSAIQENFNIEFTAKYAWKHFYGHYQFENSEEEDETLFIGIIRNPITWIDSFYNKMHHIPKENKKNIMSFLFNKFYSVYDNLNEIMEDRHILTKERYKNIFEMRNVKIDYLINDMKTKVKNYILIRYEDLRDNYDNVLDFFKNKFNLNSKFNVYKKIENYKGNQPILFVKKNITIPRYVIKIIKKNVNKEKEKSIGYNL